MRPNSSKVVEFISSWMALGCSGMIVLVVGFLSVLKPKVQCVVDTHEAVADLERRVVGSFGDGVAVAAAREAGAVGRVVGGLADDDRVLAALEHAGAVGLVAEGVAQLGQVEGRRRRGRGDLDLHDGARVGAVAGQDRRGAVRALVGRAGVVVVGRHARRERGGRVVVQDQRLAGELREVDDHVGPLGGRQQQGVLVHVADVEARRVGDPGGLLLAVDDDRRRQEPALGADLDPVGAVGRGVVHRRREDDRVGLRLPPAAADRARLRCRVPVVGSATYHWKLKKRSLAAFSMRRRYVLGCSVTFG